MPGRGNQDPRQGHGAEIQPDREEYGSRKIELDMAAHAVPGASENPLGARPPDLGEAFVARGVAVFKPEHLRYMEKYAKQWMRMNRGVLLDDSNLWELGFSFYLDRGGKVQVTELERGESAEVSLPEAPGGTTLLGSLHTHVGSEGELSDWDFETGQRIANELGDSYAMFVVGPDEDGEGLTLSCEVFEGTRLV